MLAYFKLNTLLLQAGFVIQLPDSDIIIVVKKHLQAKRIYITTRNSLL